MVLRCSLGVKLMNGVRTRREHMMALITPAVLHDRH
jgi:hypothetical protein